MKKRGLFSQTFFYWVFALGCLLVFPFWGSEDTSLALLRNLFSKTPDVEVEIFLFHRLPRVFLAFVCGAGLGVCGAGLQVILKNPLAEPFVLGISGCASLGASLALSFPSLLLFWGPFSSVQLFALAGAFCSVGLVLKFAARFGGKVEAVILAGVTVNILCAAFILMIRYAVDPSRLVVMDRWLMGGLDVVGWENILALIPFVLLAAILLFPMGGALNLMAFDTAFAEAQGVPLQRVRMKICMAVGLWVGASVAVSGPIGFVGLVVPQIIRRISGSDMRQALVFSALGGGIFLAACDMLARSVPNSAEMPVGIVTAMIGGPLFLRILWRRSER